MKSMSNTKFSVLVKIDRSGHGKAFLVCKATGHRIGSFPMSPVRFPTTVDMVAKATAWATSRSNVPAADVDVSAVEVEMAR